MRRLRVRAVLVLLLAAAPAGCVSWRPVAAPAEAPAGRTLRLTLEDGSTVVLDRATVFGDSVRGERRDPGGARVDAAYPLARVRGAESRSTRVFRSAAALAAVAVLAIGVGVGAIFLSGDWD